MLVRIPKDLRMKKNSARHELLRPVYIHQAFPDGNTSGPYVTSSLTLPPNPACKVPISFPSLLGRRFFFTGALVPKQVKRLLKTRGLSTVIVKDATQPATLTAVINEVCLTKHWIVMLSRSLVHAHVNPQLPSSCDSCVPRIPRQMLPKRHVYL